MGLGLALAALAAGCGRNDIQVYRVGKETPAPETTAMPAGHPAIPGGEAATPPAPQLKWSTPAGWESVAPGEMRAASFKVARDGKQADVSVIPLPGLAGGDLNNVNRWRDQVGQPHVTEAELPKLAEAVPVAGETAQLYDQAGTNASSGDKTRILAAILRREGTAWFFKMTGDDELVAQQKPAFLEFLKTLSFIQPAAAPELPASHPPIAGAAPSPAPSGGTPGAEGKPAWQVPPGWKETDGGQFLVAKFLLAGPDNAQAAVNVSMSAGDGGGLTGNVNRWRGQLGLGQLSVDEIAKLVQTIDVAGGKASFVDLSGTDARTGQKARLVGAQVPQANQTWFYKLMGTESLVDREKDAFVKFVQSAKY
jgi:hypothetical protein